MSKKDTEKLLRITMDFLEGLTAKQFQELMNGQAIICFEAKTGHTDGYNQMIQMIKQESNVEKVLKTYTKKELASFCNYFGINIKSRDTKRVIYQKITSYLKIGRSFVKEPVESADWKHLESALHKCSTLDEARKLLMNNNLLRLKRDIIAFSRVLGVYINQKYTKQELLERIVDSVVGARIRGKIIRLEE
ncbi:hypothetical protein [Virgibacillus doumboii]|uniref:hypothetical protein n=1 Tax=Virgibacillus doumboii TaxID=2697503 RepID=UPI0013DEF1E3|nr:hypothetical protein [Virgibacillus doumboii]